ncbi:unnamed protein product [Chrysoparadoxa australica]
MSWETKSPVIIDNGTGYTKMGFAGNVSPQHIIPTACAQKVSPNVGGGTNKDGITDLDFYIGAEAFKHSSTHQVTYPIRHGIIEDWDCMERLWQQCIFKYLKCEPEDHYMMLTEPPMNTPENRELTAEVMFETFGVPGLYIAVQAVMALAASWGSKKAKDRNLTGAVVDSGDGVTHVVPVVEGYVIGSCIKSIPMAGRTMTQFIIDKLRERGTQIPPEDMLDAARRIKEEHCYVCADMTKEATKYDADPAKYCRMFRGTKKDGTIYDVNVQAERFLGPEMFFSPEIYKADCPPLPDLVDEAILRCPIDNRRGLYSNVVLSGGSTMFKDFGRRLQKGVKKLVEARMETNRKLMTELSGLTDLPEATPIDVNVISHPMQRYAVWFGSSLLASTPEFTKVCCTKGNPTSSSSILNNKGSLFSLNYDDVPQFELSSETCVHLTLHCCSPQPSMMKKGQELLGGVLITGCIISAPFTSSIHFDP